MIRATAPGYTFEVEHHDPYRELDALVVWLERLKEQLGTTDAVVEVDPITDDDVGEELRREIDRLTRLISECGADCAYAMNGEDPCKPN